MGRVVVLRGLPGAGKSTWVRQHAGEAVVCSADHYFETPAGYQFDESRLGAAHAACVSAAIEAMAGGAACVVVDNTHSCRWEWQAVGAAAAALGYGVELVDLFDAGLDNEALAKRNTHGVPAEVIATMRARWEA
jgi:predicted kinase